VVLGLAASPSAWADPPATTPGDRGASPAGEPAEWLHRMNEALTTRNYDGTFFLVRDGRVETLRIVHRVEGGEVRERLVSLDGPGREFIRSGSEMTCYLPDQKTVLVERRPQEGPLLGNLPRFDASTASLYEVRSAERLRFMDRDARLVEVAPRDAYRYGYRLWIDEKTAMPLKTQLCDERGNVIEQIVFASLALSQSIPDSAFDPQVSTAGFRWLRQETRAPLSASQPALWSALRLPPGFRMTSHGQQVMPGADGPVAHLVFSDGVASVSVFVESARASAGSAPRLDGATSVGASAAYSTVVDGHQVTAVGEVPAQTVRFIADQVRASRPAVRPAGVPGGAPALRAPPGGPPVQAPAFAPGPAPRR